MIFSLIPEHALKELTDLICGRLQNEFVELRQENIALRAEIKEQNVKLLEAVQKPWWKLWK